MMLLPDLITKLKEIEEYYPSVPVDITSINIHVSILKDEHPVILTLTKNECTIKKCTPLK